MNKGRIIVLTKEFVRQRMSDFDSGHDWYHVDRVRKLAAYINDKEKLCDPFTLDIAVLLHDTADSKFNREDPDGSYKIVEEFMDSNGLGSLKFQVIEAIRNVSYSNKKPSGNLKDPLLLVLQDADRLDAIGAIGIARAFNYGGFRNNAIYIPENETPSTIRHFYDKLLLLKDMMNTATGKRLAEERHLFLEVFLKQFFYEWKFEIE